MRERRRPRLVVLTVAITPYFDVYSTIFEHSYIAIDDAEN